jgi:transposase
MESTGVYWKPVFYVLEEGFTCLLVNAVHVHQVPGRKTDVQDCAWIAQLLEHGLLRESFVPPAPIRDLRDLTRYRKVLSQDRTAAANRLHKVLEDTGIKLASVATDILGVSGPQCWTRSCRERVRREAEWLRAVNPLAMTRPCTEGGVHICSLLVMFLSFHPSAQSV